MTAWVAVLLVAAAAVVPRTGVGDEPGRTMALIVNKTSVELRHGDLSVKNSPGVLTTRWAGPFGSFASDGLNMPLAEIRVDADTDTEKRVRLVSPVQHSRVKGARSAVFTIVLSARAGVPGIALQARMTNVGKYPADGHYFYRLAGLKFPYYYDSDGWQSARQPDIPAADWYYLPSANTTGGYGLVAGNGVKPRINTLYPRQDWQAVGLYFLPGDPQRSIQPGATAVVEFLIFPATSPGEVQARVETIRAAARAR